MSDPKLLEMEGRLIGATAALEEIATATDLLLSGTYIARESDEPDDNTIYRIVRLVNSRAYSELRVLADAKGESA